VAFLCPAGLLPAGRFLAHGDETHITMGVLAGVFTVAVLITTTRIYGTVESSLELQFENRDLVQDLRRANEETEALNQALELRVQERTAELQQSTEQLRAEIAHREQIQGELLRVRNLESLGALAGGIAHDFNNFLTIVQGNTELVKEQLGAGDPIEAILDETARACRRAASLSAQLLTFAKGGAPVRRVVPVGNLIMDAVHLVRAGAPISVSVAIAEDLQCAPVDPAQMAQVLHSILLNARESMPDGGIIEVSAENAVREEDPDIAPRVRISIRDYGCGIPRDIVHRIFDPYFSTKPGHRGLGLATAHAIVAKHGGHIAVDSKLGDGTVFTIELPASDERPVAQVPPIAQPQTATGRLLVMDDEEGVRKLLETFLTRVGYEVETARDGAEAIKMYQAAKAAGRAFDAVLLDLTVSGGMGGIETAVKLKELDPSIKLIVSSGYSDAPVMSDFAKYGFDAMIPKPSNLNEIADVFRRVLVQNPD
jgi:signal transduction histidine kinase/CheY-like chemotaxis protein